MRPENVTVSGATQPHLGLRVLRGCRDPAGTTENFQLLCVRSMPWLPLCARIALTYYVWRLPAQQVHPPPQPLPVCGAASGPSAAAGCRRGALRPESGRAAAAPLPQRPS
eukprot:COSAG01_NODE_6394_length_3695_cov_5.273081_4_plen_110_part_00